MTAKTYAPRTRQLAADVILQAAVDEAVALLSTRRSFVLSSRPGERGFAPRVDTEPAFRVLLRAAQTADLLLGTP